MGPYAGVDYSLTLCPLQSRLQHNYHGQPPMPESTPWPYAIVDFYPQSGTSDLASDRVIYSLASRTLPIVARKIGMFFFLRKCIEKLESFFGEIHRPKNWRRWSCSALLIKCGSIIFISFSHPHNGQCVSCREVAKKLRINRNLVNVINHPE